MWPGRKPIIRKAHGLCSSFGSRCKSLTKCCTEWGSYLELEPVASVSLFIAVSFLSWRCLWPFISPNIHIQILQAGLLYFSLKNELNEFDKRSKHFLLSDHFINSHSLISWHCMDIVRRKWVAHWNTSFSSMDFLSMKVAGFYEVLLGFKPTSTKKFLKAKFLVLEMYFI